MGIENFKKKEEINNNETIHSFGDFSNNSMAEKLAGLSEKSKVIKSKEIEPQKPFTRQNAENEEKKEELKPQSLGAAAAKEINDRKEQKKNIIRDAYDKQIFDMESELRDLSKSQKVFDKVATLEQKEERKKKIAVLEQGIKDAKVAKSKMAEKKLIRLQNQVDDAERRVETYGENILTKKSIPEDAIEENFKQKEIKAREEFKKLEEEKESKIEIISPMGSKSFSEEQIEEAKKAKESLEKTREKIAESERVIELGDIHKSIIEPTPGEEILLTEEEKKIEAEIEKMPDIERGKIGFGFHNLDFFTQEGKSRNMAKICERFASGEGTIGRFFSAMAGTYRKNENMTKKRSEGGFFGGFQNKTFLLGNIMKYGRTMADVVGWTAGSPLRYVMLGAQFFSRGAEAAKEARLKNEEVIEKTRIKDIDEAAEEAWRIYEMAQKKFGGENVSKENLEKAYAENLPQDLLNRLKKSEPGMATGILSKIFQKILRKDVEFAIKHGKFSESSFDNRLKEFDRLIGHYGTVDALAIGARYAETAGKAVIAGVQIETVALLMQRLPEIMSKLPSIYEHTATSLGLGGVKPSDISSVGAKIGMPTEETALQPETVPQPEVVPQPEAPVEKIIDYQGGKSIWQESEKQLAVRFKEFADLGGSDSKMAEALKTYNIDRIKDIVVGVIESGDKDLIEKYGLAGISDPDKLTVDQLKGIKWSNVFEDTLKEKGLVENLRPEQVESIVKNNATSKDFFKQYPDAPRTSGNYEDILKGKGNTGIVSKTPELSELPEPPKEIEMKNIEPVNVEEVSNEDINKWVEKEFNVSPEKSNILNAEVLKNMHLRNVKVSDFIEDKDKFLYGDGPAVTRPELNEVQQWDLKEKIKLIDKVEEILKKMNSMERLKAEKLTVPELILEKFIKK
ncbi:MAG: hypothetical protein AAB698_00430 [Patescibacteria group bacterium]